jgi:hypothetical protein
MCSDVDADLKGHAQLHPSFLRLGQQPFPHTELAPSAVSRRLIRTLKERRPAGRRGRMKVCAAIQQGPN